MLSCCAAREAACTNEVLVRILQTTLAMPAGAIQLLNSRSHESAGELMRARSGGCACAAGKNSMPLLLGKILAGLLVGMLIGMSGLGGGVALLPILIFGLGVPTLVAVGSAAAFNALTKVWAGLIHWRNRTVCWPLVLSLASGSLPGTLLGVLFLGHLRTIYGVEVNHILRNFIGLLLVAIPAFLLLQGQLARLITIRKRCPNDVYLAAVAIGFGAGFLVGMSSVGSGTVIMALLLLYVQCPAAVLVGTDITHAVVLTGVTCFLDWHLGTVDFSLVLPLLVGSIPGAVVGVKLSTLLPLQWLRYALCVTLMVSGARMLWV